MKECTLPTSVLDVVWEPVHERVVDELGKEQTDGERGYALPTQHKQTYCARQSSQTVLRSRVTTVTNRNEQRAPQGDWLMLVWQKLLQYRSNPV